MLGFAAGVMIAASFWSLLIPALDLAEMQETITGIPSWAHVALGFSLGGLFIMIIDKILPHLHLELPVGDSEGPKTSLPRSTLLILAITLHNIPEGLAVGVVFGAVSLGLPRCWYRCRHFSCNRYCFAKPSRGNGCGNALATGRLFRSEELLVWSIICRSRTCCRDNRGYVCIFSTTLLTLFIKFRSGGYDFRSCRRGNSRISSARKYRPSDTLSAIWLCYNDDFGYSIELVNLER